MPRELSQSMKLLASSAIALGFALSAGVTYAQVETEKSDPEMTQMEMKEAAEDIAEDAEDLSDAMDEWSDDSEDMMDDEAMMEDDIMDEADVMDADVDMMESKDDEMRIIVREPDVDVEAAETISVDCPDGTTAQPDGSCMVTGDFEIPEG